MSEALPLARHYLQLGQFDNVLTTLARGTGDDLEDDTCWVLRAEALRRLGRGSEAIEAARAGLLRWPENIALLDTLGLSLVARGDVAAGDATYLEALRLAPQHPVVLGHHALALAKLGRLDEARAVVQTVLTIAPDSVTALQIRAQVAFIGKDPNASRYVDELLARDPENTTAHILRGNLAVRRRAAKPAAEAFAEAAMLDPSNPSVVRAARASRLLMHPLLIPSRWILMLGRWQAQVLYIVVVVSLFALGEGDIATIVVIFWVVFVVVTPRVLRRNARRKYGDL